MESIARSYIDLRQDGCVQFDNLLVFVYCDPEHESGVEVRLRSMLQKPIEGDTEKDLLSNCEEINSFLQECIQSWRQSMIKHRR